MNVSIIYWSGTGNTQKMAEMIEVGAKEAGHSVSLIEVGSASTEDVVNADVVALGCPSMGAEVLEECAFQPYYDLVSNQLGDKAVALFGSYDWGDGEWIRNWQEDVENKGGIVKDEPLIIHLTPDAEGEVQCVEFGKKL